MVPLLSSRIFKSCRGFQICTFFKEVKKIDGWMRTPDCAFVAVEKHHNHVNQKSALTISSSDYGA